MSEPHDYDRIDDELTLSIGMRELAHRVVAMNRGTHRLLSHLADAIRAQWNSRATLHRAKGDDEDVAANAEHRGRELAEALEHVIRRHSA